MKRKIIPKNENEEKKVWKKKKFKKKKTYDGSLFILFVWKMFPSQVF